MLFSVAFVKIQMLIEKKRNRKRVKVKKRDTKLVLVINDVHSSILYFSLHIFSFVLDVLFCSTSLLYSNKCNFRIYYTHFRGKNTHTHKPVNEGTTNKWSTYDYNFVCISIFVCVFVMFCDDEI